MDHEQPLENLPPVRRKTVMLFSIGVLVIFAALFLVGYIPHRLRAREAQRIASEHDERPSVPVVQPRRSESAGDLVLPGDARAYQETAIYPRANGYLKHLLVDIGDRVKAGQLLAEIDAPEVDAQLNEARAALQQANANLNKAKTDFELAQTTLNRYESLAKTGAVMAQDLDEKRGQFNQTKAARDAAIANVAAAQASVQRLTDLQSFEKVTAPFSGVVATRNYDLGALLNPSNTSGRELFRLAQTDTLRVFVNVPQSYVTSIKIGQAASFESRNFPGRAFPAKITRSAGAIDPATRTMRFQIDCPNPGALLFAGMYGQMRFAINSDHPPLLVPTSALLFRAEGTQLAIVENNKVRIQKVTLGRDLGTDLEVVEGLSGDEQIVASPGERLADGSEVTPVPMASSPTQPPKTSTAAR